MSEGTLEDNGHGMAVAEMEEEGTAEEATEDAKEEAAPKKPLKPQPKKGRSHKK